jgi:hypothetical protein
MPRPAHPQVSLVVHFQKCEEANCYSAIASDPAGDNPVLLGTVNANLVATPTLLKQWLDSFVGLIKVSGEKTLGIPVHFVNAPDLN